MVVEEWIVVGKRIVQVASHVSEDRLKKLEGIRKAVWRTIAARPGPEGIGKQWFPEDGIVKEVVESIMSTWLVFVMTAMARFRFMLRFWRWPFTVSVVGLT